MATPWRGFFLILAVHVGLGSFLLTLVPARYVHPHTRWEVPAVGMALYERGEFADPYCLPTGPTAHMPPFWPALIAVIYHLLGPTPAAGVLTWLLAIAFEGLLFALLPWLGARLGFGARAGLAAGLVGAVVPRFPGYAEGLTGVALSLMLVVYVDRWEERRPTASGSLGAGLATGLAFHVAPTLLPVALGYVACELLLLREPARWRWAALTLLGLTLACVPWTLRNQRVLGGLFFVRSNFGLELRMGNHEGAGANLELSERGGTLRHPRTDEAEAREVARLGELSYMRRAGREARNWIRSHPGEFLRLSGLRIAQLWLGPIGDAPLAAATTLVTLLAVVGAARHLPRLDLPRRVALLVPLVTYPLVHYVVGYEARYRRPLDGLLLLLAAAAFTKAEPGRDG